LEGCVGCICFPKQAQKAMTTAIPEPRQHHIHDSQGTTTIMHRDDEGETKGGEEKVEKEVHPTGNNEEPLGTGVADAAAVAHLDENDSATKSSSTRRKWSNEEDRLLKQVVPDVVAYCNEKEMKVSWAMISKRVPNRTPKQCRDRWTSLQTGTKKRKWSPEEDNKLLQLYKVHKNSWVRIAEAFPHRNDNMIKSRYRALMRRNMGDGDKVVHSLNSFDSSNGSKKRNRKGSTSTSSLNDDVSNTQQGEEVADTEKSPPQPDYAATAAEKEWIKFLSGS